jgi:putative DNA primase/helicase
MRDYTALAARARSLWIEILIYLGIDPARLVNRHGPCPGCGGTDRFRFDDQDGRGTWICGGGGEPQAGDGFSLLSHVHGWDASESYLAVARYFGIADQEGAATAPAPRPTVAPARHKRDLSHYARALWARVDREDSLVASHPYAAAKAIDWACGAGRAIVQGTWSRIGANADCIVVPIRTPEGELCAVECLSDRRDASGKFQRQSFGAKNRGWLTIGNDLAPNIPRHCVEGWATGARLAAYKRDCCVYVAFGSGRLSAVAEAVERMAPGSDVLIWQEAAHG